MTSKKSIPTDSDLLQISLCMRDAQVPIPLSRVIRAAMVMSGSDHEVGTADFLSWLEEADPNNSRRAVVATAIACWDATRDAEWVAGTLPNTQDRRALIIRLMELSETESEIVNRTFPQSPSIDAPINITKSDGWTRWYYPDRRRPSFYWDSYKRYLVEAKKWEPKSVAALDVASTDVIERLRDPIATEFGPNKGLVIGYVQSGKTANFTGVIAKAVDAGYRLVIVLAGTQNILRAQTQRRIDKELLGKEFVAADYQTHSDWQEFVSHNCRPSDAGAFDWVRLTTANQDFRDVAKGLVNLALMFESADKMQPFRSPTNLRRSHARLAVVKKNPKALGDFINSLTGAATHVPLREIPTLIIDDESDQASINTQRPRAGEARRRKAINGLIVEMLRKLGNAQYVGYTATPFANVFVDPEDAMDLFPSDFILSLPKPMHYMGVRDFTDDSFEADDERSNRWAHVREICGPDEKEGNLDVAIDAYLLSGAVKVYRERALEKPFRHHTMLVHSSPLQRNHSADAARVSKLFMDSNYLGKRGMARLQRLWESDFAERCRKRAGDDPVPSTWRELEDCVPIAYGRITDDERPVIVLNGNDNESAPDFNSESVWKIIVGGAKLSRGYTVEGLTVSYYRRTARAADTLLQMGRWFGFRPHYRDLVRLYIGVDEMIGKKGKKLNLYDAFEAACRDEEEFRGQLSRYASLEPSQRITPKDVPPLVPAHMLPPTASNKMFNSVQKFINFGGEAVERTSTATDGPGRIANVKLVKKLMDGAALSTQDVKLAINGIDESFKAVVTTQTNGALVEFLENFKWESGAASRDWTLVTEFVRGSHGDPQIDSWLVMAPQMKSEPHGAIEIGKHKLRIKQRGRTANRFLVFTEPEHRRVAKWVAGHALETPKDTSTANLAAPRRAVILLYPVIPTKEPFSTDVPAIGFALYFPKNSIRRQVLFTVRNKSRPNDIVVTTAS